MKNHDNRQFWQVVIRGLDCYCEEDASINEAYRPEDMDVIKKGLRCLQKKD